MMTFYIPLAVISFYLIINREEEYGKSYRYWGFGYLRHTGTWNNFVSKAIGPLTTKYYNNIEKKCNSEVVVAIQYSKCNKSKIC